jgi:hypothetical protein
LTEQSSSEIQRARRLTAEFMAGGPRSFDAFRDLAQLLLQATVLDAGQAVRLSGRGGRRGDDLRVLAGVSGPTDPLRLRDGRWLRLAPLSRIHFPTSRVPMEAGVRLLADDFAVPTATSPATWRPLLAASETAFHQIAHQPAG